MGPHCFSPSDFCRQTFMRQNCAFRSGLSMISDELVVAKQGVKYS